MTEPTAKTGLTQVQHRLTDQDARMVCHLRKTYHYTVAELASRMEVSESTIQKVLQGKVHAEATRDYRTGHSARNPIQSY